MIKTLRITSIIAAALAVVFFVFLVFFGARGDGELQELLDSPGVVEAFNEQMASAASRSGGQSSPLVKQADAYGLYLNPPAPPKPKTQVARKPVEAPRPRGPVTAKFPLLATCYHPSQPERSLALIQEPGKELRWVKQGNAVEHLVIEEIKDGRIVVRDGQRTFEIEANKPKITSLLEGSAAGTSAPAASAVEVKPAPEPAVTMVGKTTRSVSSRSVAPSRATARSLPPQPQVSQEETAFMEKLLAELGGLGKSSATDQNHAGGFDPAKSQAVMEKILSEFQAMRISEEEARGLERLGKDLNNAQKDPNLPRSIKIERPKARPRPGRARPRPTTPPTR